MRPGPPSWLFSYFGRGPAARARACSTGHGFYNPATCPTTHRLAMPKQVSIYGLHRPSDWSSAKGSATLAGYAVSLWMGLRPSPGLGGPPSWLFSCSVVNHPPGRHHPNHTTKHQTTTRGTPTHSRRPTLARPGPFTRRSALGQPTSAQPVAVLQKPRRAAFLFPFASGTPRSLTVSRPGLPARSHLSSGVPSAQGRMPPLRRFLERDAAVPTAPPANLTSSAGPARRATTAALRGALVPRIRFAEKLRPGHTRPSQLPRPKAGCSACRRPRSQRRPSKPHGLPTTSDTRGGKSPPSVKSPPRSRSPQQVRSAPCNPRVCPKGVPVL